MLKQNWHRSIRQSTSISLIILDIDFFKLYNDHYGHQQGDSCLQEVAAILEKSVTRETDLVARYGGEEFVAILPETGHKGALEIAEVMRKNIEDAKIPHADSKVSDYVSISLGVSTALPERNTNPESLVGAADKGLYRAKDEGRNQTQSGQVDLY